MAIINEYPIWEEDIYELETTDQVLGGTTGISNLSSQQLTNRSRKTYEVLEENGIYLDMANQTFEFTGQNIDVSAEFEGTVSDGDVVYYNDGNSQYELAIADGTDAEVFVGVADVTNGKVISGGLLGNPVITGSPSPGDLLYLSNLTAGQLTTTASSAAVGKYLASDLMSLNSGVGGGSGGSDYNDEQDSYRMLLDGSYFNYATYDDLTNADFIDSTTMDYDYGNSKLDFTAGEIMTSVDLKDPLASVVIDEVFVSVDYDGSITIEVTADGGSNWETVSDNNVVHIFSNTGSDLRIRITGNGTGDISGYTLLYEKNLTRVAGLTSVPTGQIILFESDVAVFTYTLLTDADDGVIYYTSGSVAGGETAGTYKAGGTWTQPDHAHIGGDHTLLESEMPSHTHGISNDNCEAGSGDSAAGPGTSKSSTPTGGNGSHNHGSTSSDATADTYRPTGRNFTRQERL